MSRFVSRAVRELADLIESGIAAQLRLVETDESLTANSLTDPVDVIRARVPNDNRSPLIQVYDVGWQELQHRNDLIAVACEVVFSYTGTADAEATEDFCRRYQTAIRSVMMADPTSSGDVVAIVPRSGSSAVNVGDDSQTRMIYLYNVDVHVHSP